MQPLQLPSVLNFAMVLPSSSPLMYRDEMESHMVIYPQAVLLRDGMPHYYYSVRQPRGAA
jgi:hypothetical protein